MPSDHALSTSRLTLLLALALMLLVQSGCGTGSGQTNLALVGGAIRPSRQAYEVTPDAAAVLPLGATVEIPTHVDLRSDGVIPPVQNQIWNSCVGWSLGYYLMTAIEARRLRNAGLWLDMNDPENWFAPDFVYSQRDTHPLRLDAIDERVRRNDPISQPICFESDGDIGCMRPEKALAAIMKHGCCRWTWMCGVEGDPHYRPCGAGEHLEYERPSRAPWQFTITHSGYFRPRCYVRFGALDDLAQGTVRRMQSWLDREGTPIAIVVNMMSGWVTFGGENATDVVVQDPCGAEHVERRSVCLDAGGDDLGSQHMMTVIGYDRSYPSRAQYPDAPEGCEGSFLIVNQWGEKWGDRGFMWIPCAELARIWVGGYGILPSEAVEWNRARTSRQFVCFQDENGQYINISSDLNDVPANLLTPGERCKLDLVRAAGVDQSEAVLTPTQVGTCEALDAGAFPALDIVVTADEVVLPAVGSDNRHGPANVGGDDASTGNTFDTADWYHFDVSEADTSAGPLVVRARLDPPPPSADIQVHIRDASYAPLSVALPAGAGAEAVLPAGRYFVQVDVADTVNRAVVPLSGFAYDLVLEVRQDAPGTPGGTPPPPAATEVCVDAVPQPVAVAGGTGAPARILHRVQGLAPGNTLHVALTDVAGGAAPELQLVVAVFQRFQGFADEDWFREARSALVGAQGGALTVRLAPELGRGTRVGGRHDPTDVASFDVYVGVRNRTPQGATAQLRVRVCGPTAPAAPAIVEVTGQDLVDAPMQFGEEDRFPLRAVWAWSAYARRHLVAELRDFCGSPDLALHDTGGGALTAADGFEISTSADRSGLWGRRVTVPATFVDDVWCSLVDRDTAAPLATYALRMLRAASFELWPLVQNLDRPRDDVNVPSEATDIPLSAAPLVPSGLAGPYEDWWDFYRVVNDTAQTQDVTVRLELPSPTSASIVLRHWGVSPLEDFEAAPDALVGFVTLGIPSWTIHFTLEPGQSRLVMLEWWVQLEFETFDATPLPYDLVVSTTPP